MSSHRLRWGPLFGLGLAACSGGGTPAPAPDDHARMEISTSPLSLTGIAEAIYDVTVENADGDTVWTKSLSSVTYSDGRGGIRYVGPCDASSNPNTVTLTVKSLVDTAGDTLGPRDWIQPPPMVQDVVCEENTDVPVVFNVTVMRDADQGTIDFTVHFDDIFCSAKLDCPEQFLYDPQADADGLTAVVVFACTAGPGQDTTLYWGDAAIVCREDGKVVATYPVNPGAGEGVHGPIAASEDPEREGVFESANYRTEESLPGLSKCSWAMALGLDLDQLGPSCTFEATATAAHVAFDSPPLHTPPNTVYPVIRWKVPLTNPKSQLLCGVNPLDDSETVTTEYTSTDGMQFEVGATCDGEPFFNGLACSGTPAGAPEITFAPVGENMATVTYNGETVGPFFLPDGATLDVGAAECCVEPCCEETTP